MQEREAFLELQRMLRKLIAELSWTCSMFTIGCSCYICCSWMCKQTAEVLLLHHVRAGQVLLVC